MYTVKFRKKSYVKVYESNSYQIDYIVKCRLTLIKECMILFTSSLNQAALNYKQRLALFN